LSIVHPDLCFRDPILQALLNGAKQGGPVFFDDQLKNGSVFQRVRSKTRCDLHGRVPPGQVDIEVHREGDVRVRGYDGIQLTERLGNLRSELCNRSIFSCNVASICSRRAKYISNAPSKRIIVIAVIPPTIRCSSSKYGISGWSTQSTIAPKLLMNRTRKP
jgi:hypothetical protein